MSLSNWMLSEMVVEAAARCGQPEAAGDAIARLGGDGTPLRHGLDPRRRGARPGDRRGRITAEDLHCEALERLGRTGLRRELARAHLVYGEWLRREGRRVDAREQLRTAHDMLTASGMEAFAERARRELSATGERARKRTVETRDDLTAQERQIAQLACDGLSNPDIGARLLLSPRTVEWHLRKVFGKLGIHSRYELAGTGTGSEPIPS
jgi:DNA-binding CsgD family transcriptional regulator